MRDIRHHRIKRILAFILCVALCFGNVGSAFAAESVMSIAGGDMADIDTANEYIVSEATGNEDTAGNDTAKENTLWEAGVGDQGQTDAVGTGDAGSEEPDAGSEQPDAGGTGDVEPEQPDTDEPETGDSEQTDIDETGIDDSGLIDDIFIVEDVEMVADDQGGEITDEFFAEDVLLEDQNIEEEAVLFQSETALLETNNALDAMCGDIFGLASYQKFVDSDVHQEVYVANTTPSESTDPLGSINHPYVSLSAAYETLKSSGCQGAIIHLSGDYNQDTGSWPNNELPAIIVSEDYNNCYLTMDQDNWQLHANTGFYNVKIRLTYGSSVSAARIYANGNTVVFGGQGLNNFEMMSEDAARCYPTVFGAQSWDTGSVESHSQVANTTIKVYGGTFSQIFGGGEYYSDVTGTSTVIVDGYVNGTGAMGAVRFDNSHLAYMEGSSNVYGGGAGTLAAAMDREYSRVSNTNVSLRYISTEKAITPNGGVVETSAYLSAKNCTVNGAVNALSEGKAASSVTIELTDCQIKGEVGVLGDNKGGVSKEYKLEKIIEHYTMAIENCEIANTVFGKVGGLSGGNHNNRIDDVRISVKNSQARTFQLATLPADFTHDTCTELIFDNFQMTNRHSCNANFEKIGTIILRNMGTEDNPFIFAQNSFGNISYNASGHSPANLQLENSHVEMQYSHNISEKLTLTNSSLVLDSGITLSANGYESTGTNQMTLKDESYIYLSGEASGNTTTVDCSALTGEHKAGVRWQHAAGAAVNKELFQLIGNQTGFQQNCDGTANFYFWYGSVGGQERIKAVYLDSENGHDEISEYNDSALTEAEFGYKSLYPVKTFDKAVELLTEDINTIVLCGYYDVKFEGQNPQVYLSEKGTTKKDQLIRLKANDGVFDYSSCAEIRFYHDETATGNRVFNLNASLQIEDIKATNKGNAAVFWMCNGYKTVIGKDVSLSGEYENAEHRIYAGSYNGNVASTDLAVYSDGWSAISVSGYGNTSSVGAESADKTYNETVATLEVKKAAGVQCSYYLYGNVYGNVSASYELTTGARAQFLYTLSTNGTIYGDLDTSVKGIGDWRNGQICPGGITVKGMLRYTDTSGENTDTGTFVLPKCTLEKGAEIRVERNKENISLFAQETDITGTVNWYLSGKANTIKGADNNQSILNGTGKVNVYLKDGANCSTIYGGTDSGEASGYSYHTDEVNLFLENTNITMEALNGFSSVTLKNTVLELASKMNTQKLAVMEGSKAALHAPVTVGENGIKNGELKLTEGSVLNVEDVLKVNGNFVGDTGENPGTLFNNNGDEEGNVTQIPVEGSISGTTRFSTNYETASIQVKGESQGGEFTAPLPDSDGKQSINVTCAPEASEGEQIGRIWTANNIKSRKYVYVDGTCADAENYEREHDGTSPERAFATLEEAYQEVLKNGYIMICGDTEVAKWPDNAQKKVTITSKVTLPDDTVVDYFSDQKAKMIFKNSLELLADTTFDNINIESAQTGTTGYVLAACGFYLVMGHEGDENSVVMTGQPISICGGAHSSIITRSKTHVTIYAGRYNIATVYQHPDTNNRSSNYQNARGILEIYGGEYDKIYGKYNLYENSTGVNAQISIENALIKTGIYVMERPYQANDGTYTFIIGEGMSFGENAVIHLGADTNYAYSRVIVNLNVDGGQTAYKIPLISNGLYNYNADRVCSQSNHINLKNVVVGELYGGHYTMTQLTIGGSSQTNIKLQDNATVETLYYGGRGSNNIADVNVTIASDTAKIDKLRVEGPGSAGAPENTKLIFDNVGTTENPYQLTEDMNLNSLTQVSLTNDSVVDITDAGTENQFGELAVDSGSAIVYTGFRYTLHGNYTAGSETQSPSRWYGNGAPFIHIDGQVTGYTQMLSMSADAGAEDYAVTGRFYNGIRIYADKSNTHTESMFTDYQSQPLNFADDGVSLDGEEKNCWSLEDQEANTDRTDVYVSSKGNNSNTGTMGAPVETIGAAYQRVEELYQQIMRNEDLSEDKKAEAVADLSIIMLGDVFVKDGDTFALPDAEAGADGTDAVYTVRLTSSGTEKKNLIFQQGGMTLNFQKPMLIDNVGIKCTVTGNSPEIFANGFRTEFTEKVTTEAVSEFYPVLYGGASDTEVSQSELVVYGGSWSAVYGGGKTSTATVAGDISVETGESIDMYNVGGYLEAKTGLFGGGFAAETQGSIKLTINGGRYHRIHGGGKESGAAVSGDIQVVFNSGVTDMFYGAGERAKAHNVTVNFGIPDDSSDFGGTKAQVTSIFRGSGMNAGLAENCSATVNVGSNAYVGNDSGKEIQFAAGGYSGNLDQTILNISGGQIESDIYAGGWGAGNEGKYGITGSTLLTINGGTITGNIYGGGRSGLVTEEADVVVDGSRFDKDSITGNIYGGGNAAGAKETSVTIKGTKVDAIKGNVFGGSYKIEYQVNDIQEKASVVIEDATINGDVFGGSDTAGTIQNGTNVSIKGTVQVKNAVYGGGSLADVGAGTQIQVEENAVLMGCVYGGGKGEAKETEAAKAAGVWSSVSIDGLTDANAVKTQVNIAGTVQGDIYGGGELATAGNPAAVGSEPVTAVTLQESSEVQGKVYGGGKGYESKAYASIYGDTSVIINGGTFDSHTAEDWGSIFGGSEQAPVMGE